MVKVASVVSVAMTTTGTMYILRMAWRHWTWVAKQWHDNLHQRELVPVLVHRYLPSCCL